MLFAFRTNLYKYVLLTKRVYTHSGSPTQRRDEERWGERHQFGSIFFGRRRPPLAATGSCNPFTLDLVMLDPESASLTVTGQPISPLFCAEFSRVVCSDKHCSLPDAFIVCLMNVRCAQINGTSFLPSRMPSSTTIFVDTACWFTKFSESKRREIFVQWQTAAVTALEYMSTQVYNDSAEDDARTRWTLGEMIEYVMQQTVAALHEYCTPKGSKDSSSPRSKLKEMRKESRHRVQTTRRRFRDHTVTTETSTTNRWESLSVLAQLQKHQSDGNLGKSKSPLLPNRICELKNGSMYSHRYFATESGARPTLSIPRQHASMLLRHHLGGEDWNLEELLDRERLLARLSSGAPLHQLHEELLRRREEERGSSHLRRDGSGHEDGFDTTVAAVADSFPRKKSTTKRQARYAGTDVVDLQWDALRGLYSSLAIVELRDCALALVQVLSTYIGGIQPFVQLANLR